MNQNLAQYATLFASRTAVSFISAGEFEDEAECGNDFCKFEGLVTFFEDSSETAVAECPCCGDTIEKYTDYDA